MISIVVNYPHLFQSICESIPINLDDEDRDNISNGIYSMATTLEEHMDNCFGGIVSVSISNKKHREPAHFMFVIAGGFDEPNMAHEIIDNVKREFCSVLFDVEAWL